MPRLLCLAIAALFAVPLAAKDPQPLAARVDALLDAPDYKHATWAALFVDAKTGEVVYERAPDRMMAPASTTKLYSIASAWVTLGKDHRFTTPVYRRGKVTPGGSLKGDLILVAQGDLTFGGRADAAGKTRFEDHDHTYADGVVETKLTPTDPLAALDDLAKQVKAAGITSVEGDVLIDDRLFRPARSTGSGPGVVSPMLVNDNVIDVTLSPGERPGDPAKVAFRPETAYLRADVAARTTEKGGKPTLEAPFAGADEPQNLALRATIPVGHAPVIAVVPVDRPAEFARTLFIEALRRAGVRVAAPLLTADPAPLPEAGAKYDDAHRVAAHTSAPLKDALTVTMKVSHNLYASTLPCLLAARKGQTTLAEGLKLQRTALADLGVDVKALSFAGGAGGANADRVTPRATVQLLTALRKRDDWAEFEVTLPVLGVDGTLAEIGTPKHPAKGKVRAKTGTMYWTDVMNDRTLLSSKALAGVMTTAGGRELTFALFVNDVPLPKGVETKREGQALARVCEAVYQD